MSLALWLQVFGTTAFAKVGKYFRALRFTCEGEGKYKQVSEPLNPTPVCPPPYLLPAAQCKTHGRA